MDVVEQMTAVALVLLLLGAALWWLKSRGMAALSFTRRSAVRRMECVERLPLGPHHTLHLVRLGDTELLVASSPSGCTLLSGGRGPAAMSQGATV